VGGKPRALPVIKMSKMLLSLRTFLFVNEFRKMLLPACANQSTASEIPNIQLQMLLSTWTLYSLNSLVNSSELFLWSKQFPLTNGLSAGAEMTVWSWSFCGNFLRISWRSQPPVCPLLMCLFVSLLYLTFWSHWSARAVPKNLQSSCGLLMGHLC
jgi:hypothetical protein